MATRYVGPGGNDGNSGLTWALRKLTLNGVENTPVVAGDVCYIGPGVYRELLTIDVSGAGGNEIVYIGDVTGEHTDGIGGIVRVTGSDNDQTKARSNCISAGDKDYRTFRGFHLDLSNGPAINSTGSCTNWIVEDCCFQLSISKAIQVVGDTQLDFIIRRCIFWATEAQYVLGFSSAGTQNANHLVENCLFLGGRGAESDDVGGLTFRNCTFLYPYYGVRVTDALPVGYTTITVENCVFECNNTALRALVLGEITEDYNTFYHNSIARTNVDVGGNSETYPAIFGPPILHSGVSQVSGFKFPWWFGELSEWSQIRVITGNNEPTEDLHGIARPVTASKNSWGMLQFADMERETGTVRTGSASMVLHDAGRHQIWVPVTATSTTISVYVYREANYAGNLPQMIVKQPGQVDDVTTDAAAASQWNLLTTTFTPAADPPYVVVELVSRNTNGANDKVFFDDLVVS